MSAFYPGWADAVATAVATGDETTRAEALGYVPRRCFRQSSTSEYLASRKRGARRGPASRYALKNLPPVEVDE